VGKVWRICIVLQPHTFTESSVFKQCNSNAPTHLLLTAVQLHNFLCPINGMSSESTVLKSKEI